MYKNCFAMIRFRKYDKFRFRHQTFLKHFPGRSIMSPGFSGSVFQEKNSGRIRDMRYFFRSGKKEEKEKQTKTQGIFMTAVMTTLRHALRHFRLFIKWIAVAVVLGIVCGLAGTLFHYLIDTAAVLFGRFGFLLFLLPAAGLLTVFSYHLLKIYDDEGTNSILRAARAETTSAFRVTPLIFLSAFLTHLCGGSAGREGAALQIGGSLGSFLARSLHMNRYEQQMSVMCGMSASFSAVFGTPLTAAFFAIEVAGVGNIFYAGLVPSVTASFLAMLISRHFGMAAPSFFTAEIQPLTVPVFCRVVLLGILCALLSILFCRTMHAASALYRRYIPDAYLRIFCGGLIVIAGTLLCGSRDYNGSGMNIIALALAGSAFPAAFLIKMLMTAATAGAGYKGGEIIPAMFIGAAFGCAAAPLIGLDPAFCAQAGLIAVFCGAVNCPVSSILLSIEFFGSGNLLLLGAASATSYMLSGYYSLYSAQKFMNSKTSLLSVRRSAK